MSFCIHNNDLALCNNEWLIVQNIRDDDTTSMVDLPGPQEKKTDVHNNVEIETYHMITSVAFSDDGRYVAVCTNRKQLCLYERKGLNLLSNRTLVRAASRVRFTPGNDIIVADKAGDAYLFSTSEPTKNGELLLGHLSMLLDVLVTHDRRYVITTDRDEKIRVSMFPNSYNILSYCLRHTKFVTNVCELPHEKNVVASAGGDGRFILWDYKSGEDLLQVDLHDQISKDDIEKFNRSLQDYHIEEAIDVLPVKHLRMCTLDNETSLAVLSFHDNSRILLYKVHGKIGKGFEASYLNSIVVENEPIECQLYDRNLWVLTHTGLKVYEFNNSLEPTYKEVSCLKKLNSSWEVLRKDIVNQSLFPILYKRKHDNVQEYLEKKKLRLENTTE